MALARQNCCNSYRWVFNRNATNIPRRTPASHASCTERDGRSRVGRTAGQGLLTAIYFLLLRLTMRLIIGKSPRGTSIETFGKIPRTYHPLATLTDSNCGGVSCTNARLDIIYSSYNYCMHHFHLLLMSRSATTATTHRLLIFPCIRIHNLIILFNSRSNRFLFSASTSVILK